MQGNRVNVLVVRLWRSALAVVVRVLHPRHARAGTRTRTVRRHWRLKLHAVSHEVPNLPVIVMDHVILQRPGRDPDATKVARVLQRVLHLLFP